MTRRRRQITDYHVTINSVDEVDVAIDMIILQAQSDPLGFYMGAIWFELPESDFGHTQLELNHDYYPKPIDVTLDYVYIGMALTISVSQDGEQTYDWLCHALSLDEGRESHMGEEPKSTWLPMTCDTDVVRRAIKRLLSDKGSWEEDAVGGVFTPHYPTYYDRAEWIESRHA